MESTIFIHIIETEYQSMLSEAKGQWKKNEGSVVSFTKSMPMQRIERFKEWFVYAMKTIEVRVGDLPVQAEDAVLHAASKTSSVPPYHSLHPKIVRALALFSDEEMVEVFGSDRASHLKGMLNRI